MAILALRAQASVPFDRAQAVALATRSGKVTEWELEREPGGSGLRYSFDIVNAGVSYEVGVDARDGAILKTPSKTMTMTRVTRIRTTTRTRTTTRIDRSGWGGGDAEDCPQGGGALVEVVGRVRRD